MGLLQDAPAFNDGGHWRLLPGDIVELPGSVELAFVQRLEGARHCLLLVDGSCVHLAAGDDLQSLGPRCHKPDVSIQVVTLDRPRFLHHALEAISQQDFPRDALEVIIIDDSPTPALAGGALEGIDKAFIAKCVRYIGLQQRVTIGAKRNLAAAISRGNVVMHWDDDDYYGPSRARLQSAPILGGEADVTLVPLVFSFHTGDAGGPDGFYEADHNTSGHLCTLCFRRSLWSPHATTQRYADSSLMEDLFLYRNLTGVHGAVAKDLAVGAVDFVYVKHPASASAVPRVGKLVCQPPAFLPKATLELFSRLRDETPAARPPQTINGQVAQELEFLLSYLRGAPRTASVPRRYFMDVARMVPMLPTKCERDAALNALASHLRRNMHLLDGPAFAIAAWCCSTLKLPATDVFWVEVSRTVQALEDGILGASDVSMLAYVAGRAGLRNDAGIVASLFRLARGVLDDFQPPDIVNLVSAMARLGVQDASLLAGLMGRFPPGRYSSEDWLRLTWSVYRLKPQWAEEQLFPRFIHAPPNVTQRIFSRLEALASSTSAQVYNSGELPIVLLRSFISPAECCELQHLAECHFQRTENIVRKVHVAIFNQPGTADHPLVLAIRSRAAALVGLSPGHCESLNLVRYEPGEQHKAHYDYIQEVDVKVSMEQSEPRMDSLLMGGQRHFTVLLYLASMAEGQGGATAFGQLGIEVRPEMGAALLWPNVGRDGKPDARMVHESTPLRHGEKFVANAWLRSEDIEHLRNVPSPTRAGVRPPWRRAVGGRASND